MEAKDLLIGHMEDLAGRAAKTGCAASKFLTPAEAQAVSAHFLRRRAVVLTLDGGFDSAERTRAVFTNPDWGSYDRADLFTALQIAHRQQDTLGHRDILGALMALGIEREALGDIIADGTPAALVCLPEISGYIVENLTKAGRGQTRHRPADGGSGARQRGAVSCKRHEPFRARPPPRRTVVRAIP